MARVKEIDTGPGRRHQVAAYRQARRSLNRQAGIVLADGVGLGKTYEALATVATLLAQRQHGKERKQGAFKVLIVVPPNLVTKWASELEDDGFLRYLEGWDKSSNTRAIYKTFSDDVVVLRRISDLESTPGKRRYGSNVLPAGCYIMNSNLLFRSERKATQIHRTLWDAVIVDEAHRISGELTKLKPHTLLANAKTKTVLLTATPFQLSPSEMKGLLVDTFGGCENGHNWEAARKLADSFYESEEFREYRRCLNHYFRHQDGESMRRAGQLQQTVSERLRERIIRNPKQDKRRYHFVNNQGIASALEGNLFELGDQQLTDVIASKDLILLRERDIVVYLNVRNQLAKSCAAGKKPFVAAALRQLLSTYEQFRNSEFARHVSIPLPKEEHPKLDCVKQLAKRIIAKQVKSQAARRRGWFEKILIFTTYVGGEHGYDFLPGEKRHGTASTLKSVLERQIKEMIPMPSKKLK